MPENIVFDVTYQQIPNPSKDYVKSLKKSLKRNNGYCLTQPDKNPDTKCPCKQYAEKEECLCGMYIRVPVYEKDDE